MAPLQKQSHVTSFSNRDNNKNNKTRVRMNPNDPEDNPQAFHHPTKPPIDTNTMKNRKWSENHKSSAKRSTSNISSNHHNHRGASVPKFGTWDEEDPSSGEGFTVIFNRVKEEKHNAYANFPSPPHHKTYSNTHQKHRSKMCCCIL